MPTQADHRTQVQDELVARMPHAIWRGDRLASCRTVTVPTGFPQLDIELPGKGWPKSTLMELLAQRPGIGEMQLLQPALTVVAQHRHVALIAPPCLPQAAAWHAWRLPTENLLWLAIDNPQDALWAAEQTLRNGWCSAVVLWQVRTDATALRRLHMAAQEADTLLWVVRPLAAAHTASPTPLRLGLHPAPAGIGIDIIKRRGAHAVQPLFLPLATMPASYAPSSLLDRHALLDRRTSAATPARSLAPTLV